MSAIIHDVVARLLGGVLLPSQLQTLIAVLLGLLTGEQAGIAAIGRKLPGEHSKIKSKMNRVFRFVSNPRINVEHICNAIIGGLGMLGKRIVVATDWTEIGSLSVLASAVVTNGRAIPIFWTVVDTTRTRKRSVEIEHMRRLSLMLAGIEAIHVLDRGFDGGDFLREIGKFCKYVVRLSKDFTYRKRGAAEYRNINDYPLKRGRRHDVGEVEYTKAHATKCRLVLLHDKNQKEPWLLATNRYGDSRAFIVEYYACRFRIEESFKDLKDIRSGFGLHGYRMSIPDHLSRMLAVVALGYWIISAGGHFGEEIGAHKELQSNTRKERELASWRVGLHLIEKAAISPDSIFIHFSQLAQCLKINGEDDVGEQAA